MANKLNSDQERYLNYMRARQNVSNLIGRIGKYRQDSYDEQVRDYERARQSAIRESMKNEQDDIRTEKKYRRYLDEKDKYDKAVQQETMRDVRGDDVRQEKQYKRYLDRLEEQRKQLDKMRQFDVSGNDVRQEKQYKRYLDALENQKKLQAKANSYAVSGDDVRDEKKFSRYLDRLAEQKKQAEKALKYSTSGDDVRDEKKFSHYMDTVNNPAPRKNMNNVFQGDMDYSTWMGEKSEGVRKALQVGNAQRATQQWWADREAGKLGANGDIAGMNQAQRDAYRKQLEEEKEKASASVDAHGRAGGVNFNGILGLYNNPEIGKYQEIMDGDYSEEEKQDAEERLYMLRNGERDEYGRSATERANEALWRLENEYDPDDMTEQTRDQRRRMVYDLMNGDGAYDGLEAEEREKVNLAIDQATGNVLAGQSDATLLENEKSNVRTINNLLAQLDYQDELEQRYNELMAGEIEGDTRWHAENSVNPYSDESWDTMKVGSDVDDVYNLLQPGAYPEKWNITETGVGAALLMNQEMKDKFISLYNAGKKDQAWAFFEGVQPYLNQAYRYFEETQQKEEASRNPIISTLGTEAAHILQPAEFLANLPGQVKALLTGEKSGVTDPYSSNYALARYKQTVRNKITENLGDFGWLYSGVMSGVDSALNVALAKGIGLTGDALQYGTLALFGTQAFDTSLQNAMASGTGNFGYDVMEAFIDSAIETATEIWSVENWLADPTNILSYVAKIAISEPSEEIVGAIAEPYIKQLLGHKHQYNDRADQIWANKGYRDGNGNFIKVDSFDDAKRQAMREWNHDIRMAAQEALLSVGPAMVYGSGQIAMNNRNMGQQIQQKEFENGQTGLDTVLESAKGMDTTTRSFQEAQKIGERLEQNRKVSPGKVGQLASDLMRESQEQAEQKAQDALRNEVRKELAGKEIRGSSAEEMTDLIMKAIDAGGIDNLSKKEREKIHDSSYGYNTYLKFVYASEQSSRAAAAQTEATKAERKAMQSISDALTQKKTQTVADDFVGKQLASQDDIDRAEGKRTQRPDEVIVQNKFGTLEGMELDEKSGEWKYRVKVDGRTEKLDASELKATNFSTAALVRQQLDNPAVYSGDYVNHLMKQINTQQNTKIGNYLRDAENVRWAAFFGEDIPATGLSEKEAKEIYRISQADLRSEWMKDQASRQENYLGKGNGRASFAGVEFGSEEWTKKLDDSGLTEEEKKTVNGLAALAVSSGIQFNFVDQINENDYIHGSEAQSGITIAIRSFDSERAKNAGQKHEMIVTVGHELTHWLRSNNAAGYIELQNYVVNTMKDRGVNIHARAQEMMDSRRKAGDNLTMSGAIEEMVANACDQVMASQEAADYLEKNNPGLYDKIRSYVKDLVQRIKTMFAEKKGWASASRDAVYNMGLVGEQVNELNRIWWGKFDEVLSGQVKELQAPAERQTKKAAASMAEQLSVAEITNGIKKGMTDEERYNVLKSTKISVKNAEGMLSNQELDKYNTKDHKTIKKNLRALANRLGITNTELNNRFIQGSSIVFSGNSIDESVQHQENGFINLAALMPVFRETFENAIPVQVADDRYLYTVNDKSSLAGYTQLLGAFKYGENVVPVKFDLKEYKDLDRQRLYVVATINEDAIKTSQELNDRARKATSSSEISIEDIIHNVNKNDVRLLAVLPSGFLNEEQMEGKREGLIKDGVYIQNKAINNNKASNPIVNMTTERIDDAIDNYKNKNAYMAYVNPQTIVNMAAADPTQVMNESKPMNGSELRNAKTTPNIEINFSTGEIVNSDGLKRLQAMALSGVNQTAAVVIDSNTANNGNRETLDSLNVKGNNSSDMLKNLVPIDSQHREELVNTFSGDNSWFKYSRAEDNGGEVGHWMMGLTESSVHTEGERALIREYRGLKTNLDLCMKRQEDYMKEIRPLEAKKVLDIEERDRLTELRNRLQIQQDKQAWIEQELYNVTRSEGYAGMMYRNSKIFDDYINGKNQAQVEAAVDALTNEVERTEKNIEKRQKAIRQMADDAAVSTIRRELKSRGLSWAANGLKKNYYTAMSTGELEGRLAEIVLKAVNGEEIQGEIESLANDMVTNVAGFSSEIAEEELSNVRGMTIVIGPGQQAEMKANHLTLKELQQRTKGSGVTFKFGPQSTLDVNAEEIGNMIPALRESLGNEKGSLEDFVAWIENQLAAKKGSAQDYGINPDEVAVVITACAQQMLDAEQGGMSPADLKKRIEAAQGEIGKLTDAVNDLMASAQEIKNSAMKANIAAGGLRADAVAAIDYYNMVARQAAEVERSRVKRTVIDELRSENTRKLIEQQMEFREKMKKDRQARNLQHDNEQLRNMITTEVKRLKDRLVAETDEKNVPEEAKPLARQLVSMLVDHDIAGFRHVLYSDKKTLTDVQMRLAKMEAAYGSFDMDADLDFLVIHAPNEEDSDYSMKDKVLEDLMHIEQGLVEYRIAEGNGVRSLADRKAALEKVQEAVTEIYDVIRARETAFIMGQRRNVLELATQMERDMAESRFKGERKGTGSKARNAMVKAVNYGNMTPEYFFKYLRNGTMQLLHKGLQDAEHLSGLEAREAQERIEKIAKDTGFATWDGQEKKTVTLSNGKQIQMSVEQLMALYATWNREKNQLRPEETSHLLKGGFVLAEGDTTEGKARREKSKIRPIRVNEADLNSIGSYLTDKQKEYADAVVEYMSTDMAKIGNEASMRTYGIRKFTESYYFPTKAWGGVLNKSSASGITNKSDNRAMRQSFSKRIRAGAKNALEIGDFTATAMKHITGMITFNTVGPAVENMNKVLNQQLDYYEDEEMDPDEAYKRNMRTAFEENYGQAAKEYLERFMEDVNGGVSRRLETSPREKLLSVFRKGAVAGSLSVSLQQPLSYIRAAMEIDTKYLMGALSPTQWGRIHDEMTKYSGIAVIKDMGRFDMNQGQSMIEFITPEGKESAGKKAWEKFSELTTIGPEKMDALTWGRMWIACKLEQEAKNPGMDTKSDEFLEKVAERFNDVMRRTQVYDSVMVKSQNMRSKNYAIKAMTSFMAEPTLSLNVLADAVVNAQEKGGKVKLAKAAATFLMSAAAQAAAKALMSSGRSPDKRKTWEEQFLTKWASMFISEANPLGLIPGFSDFVEVLKKGELTDDAMGVIGKLQTIWQKSMNWISGKDTDTYRNIEDTIGQVAQLFTNVPLKNLMRDGRAMYNFFNPNTYAQRQTSGAVLKYGILDAIHTQDNLTGVINKYMNLAGKGYFDTTSEYEKRIYNAQKRGDEQAAKDMRDYYVFAKSKAQDPEKTLNQRLNALTKADKNMTAEDKIEALGENGYKSMTTFILEQLKKGEIDRKTAEELYRKEKPDISDKDLAEKLGGIEWEYSGKDLPEWQKEYTNYTPLYDAMLKNRTDEIRDAVDGMIKMGYAEKDIKKKINGDIKKQYLAADANGRIRLKDAMEKAYKALGYTAEDADKTISNWTKEKK